MMKMLRKLYAPYGGSSASETAAFMKRKLECTPYTGNYGGLSGWVICVSGSPPKGTIYLSDFGPIIMFLTASGDSIKRITGETQVETVRAFHKKHLRDAEKPVVLDGVSE
jgi:hypothetical protein